MGKPNIEPARMYINGVARYVPDTVIGNDHFALSWGITEDWILSRTGIHERRKAAADENTNTLGYTAVRCLFGEYLFDPQDFDLIVAATYTPYDTIVNLGHYLQHHLNMPRIPVINVSSACSSVINAFEVVEGYFAMGKAKRALVIGSEHNTMYSRDDDRISGHLWGDGAVAFSVSKERTKDDDHAVKSIITRGAATSGRAMEGVLLRPTEGGFIMPNGRDVFLNACQFMTEVSTEILDQFGLKVADVDYFIPHQANLRISHNVMKNLDLSEEKLLSNIEKYGNTGCAGCGIAYAENKQRFKKGSRILMAVFGGGYSYGAMLVEA